MSETLCGYPPPDPRSDSECSYVRTLAGLTVHLSSCRYVRWQGDGTKLASTAQPWWWGRDKAWELGGAAPLIAYCAEQAPWLRFCKVCFAYVSADVRIIPVASLEDPR